jgi:hypothetical protein
MLETIGDGKKVLNQITCALHLRRDVTKVVFQCPCIEWQVPTPPQFLAMKQGFILE